LPGIRGTRLARTMTSESAQTHTTAACARVGRHGRGIRSDSIRTPPSEHLSQLPFYTRGAERESRPGQSQVLRTKRPCSRFNAAGGLRFCAYCLP
jgi:hypothetical protein